MNEYLQYIVIAIVSYLLGSINGAIIVSKILMRMDIRQHGSKNAGATNALRVMGAKKAAMVVVIDILKAVAAVVIGGAVAGFYGQITAGMFAVIGHAYPLFFGFKGGKGVATAAATVIIIDPVTFFVLISVFVLVIFLTRYVAVGSITVAFGWAIITYIKSDDLVFRCSAILLSLFIIYLHRANIGRLIRHEEHKLEFKKKA